MHLIVISKDMLPASALPAYGNSRCVTPVIDDLVRTGTLFKHCISPCPSSAMAYSCMWVGRQPYELRPVDLESCSDAYSQASVFARFEEQGFSTHVVWDQYWTTQGRHHALPIYGRGTQFYNLDIYNEIGVHRQGFRASPRLREPNVPPPLELIEKTLDQILQHSENTFTWLHCPHLLAECDSIGSDIEYFDHIVGRVLVRYERSNVFLLSDHGHMDFLRGEILYGKTMNHRVLHVPLVCPLMEGIGPIFEKPFSSVRLPELILDRKVVFDETIFSLNQLPQDPDQILTICQGRYKYWYFKKYQAEALYDLDFDPLEERNLLLLDVYSRAKMRAIAMDQAIDYAAWDEAEEAYLHLRAAKDRVWVQTGYWDNAYGLCRRLVRGGVWNAFRDRFFPQTRMRGRWGSKSISQYYHF